MKISPNNLRYQSDRRQFGALLMLLGFTAIIFPLANIVSGFGPAGAQSTNPSEIPFWGLVAGLCVFIIGVTAVMTGYLSVVHDWSHPKLTLFLMIIVQTTWIGYITDMTAVGQAAQLPAAENGFIPPAYDPTDADVKVVGALGIVGILTYGFSFAGSLAFMAWSLHAYNTGNPETRSGSYFKGRMDFYSLVLVLAGLVQFILGTYTRARFNHRVLEEGPIGVAFLVVSYPGISIFIGLVQIMNGLWGLARVRGYFTTPKVFQMSLAMQWVMVLVLQVVSQIAYLPGGGLAPLAPSLAAFSFGLSMTPAFLDYKMSSLPAEFPDDYYCDTTSSTDSLLAVEKDMATSTAEEDLVAEMVQEDIEV